MIATQEKSTRFLSVSEAAAHLGISASMILKLIKCGELKALKIGAHWRIDAPHMAAWIERKLEAPMPKCEQKEQEETSRNAPPSPKGRGKKKTS